MARRLFRSGTVAPSRGAVPGPGPRAPVPVPGSPRRLCPDSLGRSTTGDRLLPEAELLGFAGDAPSREQCWSQLSAAVADRVLELAGPTLAWSASATTSPLGGEPAPSSTPAGRDDRDDAGAVQAVVAGGRALVIAEPVQRPGPAGPVPAHRLSTYAFDESTLLHAQVAHTPAQVFTVGSPRTFPPGVAVGSRSEERSAPGGGYRLPGHLDEDTARVLRSMPDQARDLITLPLTANGDTVLRCHSFWQGASENALDVVLVVLASARRVTVASGARCIPTGAGPTSAHWALDCWHADVIERAGQ